MLELLILKKKEGREAPNKALRNEGGVDWCREEEAGLITVNRALYIPNLVLAII